MARDDGSRATVSVRRAGHAPVELGDLDALRSSPDGARKVAQALGWEGEMAKDQPTNPLEDLILDATRRVLRDGLPTIQEALVRADGLQPASIAIAVKWAPNEETGELDLTVSAKVTTPATKTMAKTRIESGQLVLL